MGGSFWQKDSLITHILFELWLITLLWIVLVFLTQTLHILKFALIFTHFKTWIFFSETQNKTYHGEIHFTTFWKKSLKDILYRYSNNNQTVWQCLFTSDGTNQINHRCQKDIGLRSFLYEHFLISMQSRLPKISLIFHNQVENSSLLSSGNAAVQNSVLVR